MQTLALDHGRLATQRVIERLQHLYMGRANGNAGRCGNRLHQAASRRGGKHRGNFGDTGHGFSQRRQRLDFLTQTRLDRSQ